MTALSRSLCWRVGCAVTGGQFSQYSEAVWKCENAENKGQKLEIPEAEKSIGQDVVLFWS